ncbi:MAG: DNA polymerase I [Clostridiales bacterium]|jgi:DNA polymerase-1|nr:DNA polymerase I [Clostridiales bacterium]
MAQLFILDSFSLLHRAYYAIKTPLTAEDGTPTNAVFGFMNMLNRLIVAEKPVYLAAAFDLPKPTFRHKMYAAYKGTRKPMPEELRAQVPLLRELLAALEIPVLALEGYEADDILGTVSLSAGVDTAIVTGDRDALQLVGGGVTVYLTKSGLSEIDRVDEARLMELYGLPPAGIVELKALMGDVSDNIPGVPGVGEKTALELLHTYGTLADVYRNIDKIGGKLHERLVENRESAYLSKVLATIDRQVPITTRLEDMRLVQPYSDRAKDCFRRLGFKSYLTEKQEEIITERRASPVRSAAKIPARPVVKAPKVRRVVCTALPVPPLDSPLAVAFGEDITLCDGKTEVVLYGAQTLLDEGPGYDEWLKAVLPLLQNEAVEKFVYDVKALRHALGGQEVRGCFDVHLAQYVTDSRVVGATLGGILDIYALPPAAPAAGLYALGAFLKQTVAENPVLSALYAMERPIADILLSMERTGCRVDVSVLDALGDTFSAEMTRLEAQAHEAAGMVFNVQSPKQLGEVLFGKMGLAGSKKGKNGAYTTDADVLEHLAPHVPLAGIALRHRGLAKLYGTYIEGLKKLVGRDGIVHTNFKQALTVTGRLSSSEPNLQNIPIREAEGREIRRAFVPRDGYTLLSADYSQIELRLLAHLSGEESLIQSFLDGEDIHTRTAAAVNGVPVSEVTPTMRREAKAVNFGIIYGISNFGLAQGLSIGQGKAKGIIDSYFARYPKVKAYLDSLRADARRDGCVKTMMGRTRYFEELASPNAAVRAFGERAAMNMPMQGTAADIMKLAMLRVDERLRQSGADARILLQVHDELILECAPADASRVTALLKEGMEGAARLAVPLTVNVERAESWFGMH